MTPRSSWKGHLKVSLVSCQVSLYPASSSGDKVAFHMLNAETGNRLRQQYVDSETGDVVERDCRVKGYEVGKGDHVVVTDEEIDGIRIEGGRDVTVEKFVPKGDVDPLYFDGHYYMAPDDRVGEEAFSVVRTAMAKRKVVGIARVVLFGRERTVMLEPRGKGILVTTLRYAYEVRGDDAYFEDIREAKPSREMVDLAFRLVDAKVGAFRPEDYVDRFQDAVVGLVRAKQLGRALPKTDAGGKTTGNRNLLESLKSSLAKGNGRPEAKPPGGTVAPKASKPPTRTSATARGAKRVPKPALTSAGRDLQVRRMSGRTASRRP